MKTDKLLIIGHFGGNKNFLDGQTVKTKILYDELKANTNWKISIVDTYYKQKNPIGLMAKSVFHLITNKKVIVLLSGNGMKFYFPILYFFSKVFNTKVYHDVIGGNLDSYVSENKKFVRYLNKFKVNWVETENLKNKLKKQGIKNCMVLPNFKRLNCISEDEIKEYTEKTFRFCTFSRVMKEKGIEDAINAINEINSDENRMLCTLDIYGVIDDSYKDRFERILNQAGDAIKYCGTVPYSESVEAIKDYYALLFPTYWHGEGFPGTIVDAFSAGLPVIATDWNSNKEIVDNMDNGILYPNDRQLTLVDAIRWLIDKEDGILDLKCRCIKKAKTYQPDRHIMKIINFIKK